MELPENIKCTLTIIWQDQKKAVAMWKELESEWYEFKWKGLYTKWYMSFQTGYDDTLKEEFFREVKFDNIVQK